MVSEFLRMTFGLLVLIENPVEENPVEENPVEESSLQVYTIG